MTENRAGKLNLDDRVKKEEIEELDFGRFPHGPFVPTASGQGHGNAIAHSPDA